MESMSLGSVTACTLAVGGRYKVGSDVAVFDAQVWLCWMCVYTKVA